MSANLTGLSPDTAYHYRILATNPGGTTYGTDQTFSTQPGSTVSGRAQARPSRLNPVRRRQ